jgi:hypothetical protein
LLYLVGPFLGFSWRYVRRNIGIRFDIDNTKSLTALGMTYTSVRQTLADCVEQLERMGLIGSKRRR